jgi:hypothetical protein
VCVLPLPPQPPPSPPCPPVRAPHWQLGAATSPPCCSRAHPSPPPPACPVARWVQQGGGRRGGVRCRVLAAAFTPMRATVAGGASAHVPAAPATAPGEDKRNGQRWAGGREAPRMCDPRARAQAKEYQKALAREFVSANPDTQVCNFPDCDQVRAASRAAFGPHPPPPPRPPPPPTGPLAPVARVRW